MLRRGGRIRRKIGGENEKGSTYVEIIMALVILGLITAALGQAITFSTREVFAQKERTIAEYLTRNQTEYIKSQPYMLGGNSTYPDYDGYKVPVPDPSYEISITGLPINIIPETGEHDGYLPIGGGDEGIQEITVEVRHVGRVVLTTKTYKVDR